MIALPAVGIDVTVLSVFGGAVGVGLGLGLQKIAANYVSGFVILLDRSDQPGRAGHHRRPLWGGDQAHRALSSWSRAWMAPRRIIPNETVITSVVVNHSYSDRSVRVDVPHPGELHERRGPRAGADARGRARHTRACCAIRRPRALLKGFADSGIDLELYVWVADPEAGTGNLRSDIYRAIWKSFNANNIADSVSAARDPDPRARRTCIAEPASALAYRFGADIPESRLRLTPRRL